MTRSFRTIGACGAVLLCLSASAPALRAEPTSPTAPEPILKAVRSGQPGPVLNPDAPAWKAAREITVPMQPQTVTTPMNPAAAIDQVRVRALHDGQWLSLRIEWKDATRSDVLGTDSFGDQVAVEFPLDSRAGELPSPMMGNHGGRVNILQWRAALQKDLDDKAGPSVHALYPNAVIDQYPDQILAAADARPYQGALAVGNPVSRAQASPVLDQVAEGWGTLTVKSEQHARGRGAWKDGTWKVVIAVPMAGSDQSSPHLAPGAKTWLAFAAWDGGQREVGARKSWSYWVPFELTR